MKHKDMSKVIRKKTGTYFRLSLSLFLFSFILLSSSFTFIIYQYEQTQSDFVENKNTHLIEITASVDTQNSTQVDPLLFNDEQKIPKLLIEKFSDSTLVYSEYVINFGITDENDEVYFIRGIDELALDALGLPELPDQQAFSSQAIDPQTIVLHLPIINVEEGGFSSSQFVEYQMSVTPYETNVPPLNILGTYSDTIFVNKDVFKSLIEKMYEIEWASFKERYDSGEGFGIEAINRMFVYVEKLSDVKSVAKILEENGYAITYTLSAFDDISQSISSHYFVMGLMLLFIFLITAVNVVISFRGYMMSMQKDMGILRHYGYSKSRVYQIYKSVILRPFLFLFLILVMYTLLLAIVFLDSSLILGWLVNITVIFLLMSTVIIILLDLLRRMTRKDVLYLLKSSKEIE